MKVWTGASPLRRLAIEVADLVVDYWERAIATMTRIGTRTM